MAGRWGERGPCYQRLTQGVKLLYSAIESSQSLPVFGYARALFLAPWGLGLSPLAAGGGGSVTRGCGVEMNQVGALSPPPFPPPSPEEQTQQLQVAGSPLGECHRGPLPQGPWTPVLLDPHGRSASESPSLSRPLPPHGAEHWQQLLQEPGRKATAEPPLQPDLPTFPLPRSSSRQALGSRSALPPCSPEDSGLSDSPALRGPGTRGRVPTRHSTKGITEDWGVASLKPVVIKGFTQTSVDLTPVSTQVHFLINSCLSFYI